MGRIPAGLEVKTEAFCPELALNQPAMTSKISPWACPALLSPKNLVPGEIRDLLLRLLFSPTPMLTWSSCVKYILIPVAKESMSGFVMENILAETCHCGADAKLSLFTLDHPAPCLPLAAQHLSSLCTKPQGHFISPSPEALRGTGLTAVIKEGRA